MSIAIRPYDTVGHPKNTAQRRKQRGFDLVQIAIVIGVIGILMAAAFVGVPSIMASVRATGEARDLQSYVMRQQQDIGSEVIDNKTVAGAGYYNESNIKNKDTGDIVNRFGGKVTFASPANDSHFTVTTADVPYRACEKLIPIVAPVFEGIKIGGTDVKTVTEPLKSAAEINKACATKAEGGKAGTVTIVFEAPR